MSNQMRPFAQCLLITTLGLGFFAPPAHTDILLQKNLVRRFDISWCPFFEQLKISFVATTPDIILSFRYSDPFKYGLKIDNIAVIEEDVFIDKSTHDLLSRDYANFRSGQYWFGDSLECFGEPFFHLSGAQQDGVPFKEVFESSGLSEWELEKASWVSGPSAPISGDGPPTDYCSSFYREGSSTGALRFEGPESLASTRISGLKVGKKYFVAGWLSSGEGEITITVDSQHVLSQTSTSFTPSGGTETIFVNLPNGGTWTATSHSDWISVNEVNTNQNGGSVTYTVADNDGDRRTGTLTIAGKVFTVFQGASFFDVPPSHPFYEQIGKLSARGVTAGCLPKYFCPDNQVSHEQMAAFVIRALGLPNPPIPAQQTFSDVPPSLFGFPFIEEMASRQINEGCSSGLYCPSSVVTREEMAFIIIKALGVFSPPTPSEQRFLDVPPSRASYAFIEEMAKRGITLGCAADLYCPDAPVTRGQMAVFLARAFGL